MSSAKKMTAQEMFEELGYEYYNHDDEVIVVRKSSNPYFILIPALYNQNNSTYERLTEIDTQMTRTRNMSYSGIDVTGNHKTAIVFQGLKDDGNYVMQIFHTDESEEKTEFIKIGDFVSDGTVFIQQTERSDSYELSLSKGESYSVWVYKSDIPENATEEQKKTTSLNQIQQEYTFNKATSRYELSREIKVTAGRIAAKELSRIQDGTVETFAAFLEILLPIFEAPDCLPE